MHSSQGGGGSTAVGRASAVAPGGAQETVGARRLLVCAEAPELGQRLQTLLGAASQPWTIVPASRLGQPLVDLAVQQAVQGVILRYRQGQTAILETLQLLATQQPGLVRFVLCQPADRGSLHKLRCLPPVVIPADAGSTELEEILTRAFVLERWLVRPELRAVLPCFQSLPTMAGTFQQVFEAVMDPEFSVDHVAGLISRDLSLTAQLLKVSNSAYFGRTQPVQSVSEAVGIVGASRLQALVLSAQAFSFIDEDACPGFSPAAEWEHAMAVAAVTQRLAQERGVDPKAAEAAFTGGALHDLGRVLLAANLPTRYAPVLAEARGKGVPLWLAEQAALGFSHAELGACLLGIWGLPLAMVATVAWHHNPAGAPDPGLAPLLLVHLADCEVRGLTPDPAAVQAPAGQG